MVKKGFSERIAKLVRSHVEAKRFLTFRYPEYFEKLSDASKITLQHQGGRMNAEEAEAFEADPMFDIYIKMRTWDDLAKITNKDLPDLNRYKQMAISHLMQNN